MSTDRAFDCLLLSSAPHAYAVAIVVSIFQQRRGAGDPSLKKRKVTEKAREKHLAAALATHKVNILQICRCVALFFAMIASSSFLMMAPFYVTASFLNLTILSDILCCLDPSLSMSESFAVRLTACLYCRLGGSRFFRLLYSFMSNLLALRNVASTNHLSGLNASPPIFNHFLRVHNESGANYSPSW